MLINMDVSFIKKNMDVSLFAYLSFLYLPTLNSYCIDLFYPFKWINIVYLKKKSFFTLAKKCYIQRLNSDYS